jgi:acyl-CoA thioester hydrolase
MSSPSSDPKGAFEPPPGAFSLRFRVETQHIDELGHAGNVTWVKWVNDVAIAHSTSVGLTAAAYQTRGIVWVVRKHLVEYLGQALEGEELEATTWIAEVRGATSLRRTRFIRVADGRVLARAATTWALIDFRTGRPTRVPPDLMDRYGLSL